MMWSRMRPAPTLVAGLTMLLPAIASAGDGVRVRSKVSFEGAACRNVIDTSQTPSFHLEYGAVIPTGESEDTDLTADEVPDGRRFQFISMCRDNSPQEFLPRWISAADVQEAIDNGMEDALAVTPDQIMEDPASGWSDCFGRINADDARIQITLANAAAGLDWDLTGVDPGVYRVHGYTWDPMVNEFVEHPGFFKIHDGDPSAAGPGLSVTTLEQILYLDEVATIEGCVDALEGATIDVYWSFLVEPDWQPYLMGEAITGDEFMFEFDPPEELKGNSVMLRVDVTDASGTYTGYMTEPVVVLTTNNPDACTNQGGGFIGDPGCADTGGDGSGDGTGADTGVADGGTTSGGGTDDSATTAMMSGDDDGSGGGTCACRSGERPDAAGLGLFALLGLLGLRRRRAV